MGGTIRSVGHHESEPGIETTGFAALQVHSGPPTKVEFRNLILEDLASKPL
jgi:hypothetical protein